MTVDTPDAEGLRADARRNRTRVLDVALETFAAEGTSVTLGEIARRAGVGAGTVYRHFPSKEKLFEAVITRRTSEITAWGRELCRREGDPGDRFFAFFEHVVKHGAVNRALCEGFHSLTGEHTLLSAELFDDYLAVLSELLTAAQEAGVVRADVDRDDVQALVGGTASMEFERRASDRNGLLARVVAEGLRADVTKPLTEWSDRNETTAAKRNETPPGAVCEQCGRAIEAARTGRPARYCGPACRQKAHRERRA
ncbi:TetR/AcrR family transcriptional regulator [Phytomonospora sp. NPDC050363]|uniref:TetR/AcrR family transcriptional regulator n=1 Tax=Phytomonospora sp. NPDC050363 TaxID=3155642 RepID=UPI0033ED8EB8